MYRKHLLAMMLCLVLLFAALPVLGQGELHGYDGAYQYVAFGTYPHTKEGGVQPIVWRVLQVQNDVAYLLSDQIIDVKRIDGDQWNYKGWLSSELHAWMQEDFIQAAFTVEEQQALHADDELGRASLPSSDDIKNKAFGFVNDKSRFFYGTEYAFSQGLYSYTRGKYSPIFTRTVSSKPHAHRSTKVDGSIGFIGVESDDLGFLPVIWLDTSKVQVQSGSGSQMDPLMLTPREKL